jgi:hypothetical protein
MTIYLVYGLTKYDTCEEPFVKKIFKNKEKAHKYLEKEAVCPSFSRYWYIEEKELE